MISTVRSAALVGVDARLVEVEAELSMGLPFFSVIGLGSTAVQEARYRIQAALRAGGLDLPHKKITINLAPAAQRKEGAAFDLPMAVALLVAADLLPPDVVDRSLVLGELSLTGQLRPVRGVLSAAALARRLGARRIVVPQENGAEAANVEGLEILGVGSLTELLAVLRGERPVPQIRAAPPRADTAAVDFAEVRGQTTARRALEIAAAGGHNTLLVGSPGCGKTMLARRVPSILPPLVPGEAIEVTQVWSAAGLLAGGHGLVTERPFRAPHSSISEVGMVGGGHPIRPGEVSLAHHGVLFLDEMPEIPRRVLESLRQPLEDRAVLVSRARQNVRLPARFMLLAAANPCPCGWRGHPARRCTCGEEEVRRYFGRISGPLLDRMDMIIETQAIPVAAMLGPGATESSAEVRARVCQAQARARARQGTLNAELGAQALRRALDLETAARELLLDAAARMDLSARSVDRVLRVARTVADLGEMESTPRAAVAEALAYRLPPLLLSAGQASGLAGA